MFEKKKKVQIRILREVVFLGNEITDFNIIMTGVCLLDTNYWCNYDQTLLSSLKSYKERTARASGNSTHSTCCRLPVTNRTSNKEPATRKNKERIVFFFSLNWKIINSCRLPIKDNAKYIPDQHIGITTIYTRVTVRAPLT